MLAKKKNFVKIGIVGGGICGLYLAFKLSKKGYKVFLFEKEKEIGKKPCSCLLSERIFDFLPQAENLVKNKILACKIHFPKKEIEVNFKKDFFVFERKELDNLVFDLAQKAKAKIYLNFKIKNFENFSKKFDFVFFANGALSQGREYLKLKKPAFFLTFQGFLKKEDFSQKVEVWPLKKGGFLWKIPRGKETEYGIIGKIKNAKEDFEKFLGERKIRLAKIKSALLPQGFILSPEKRIALLGDAAGLTKPWSGGGIIWGLRVGECYLENFPDFEKAKRKIRKIFLKEIILAKIFKKIVYFLGFNLPYFLPKRVKIDGDYFFEKK